MPTKKAVVIIDKVVRHLSTNSGVAAIVLAGSQVEGNKFAPDEFSDIELYVVAFDEQVETVEAEVQKIQNIFTDEEIVLSYKNQWAGWSILYNNLLRLELPLVKASNEEAFSRSDEQKIDILYSKKGFQLKKKVAKTKNDVHENNEEIIKDFWYMTVYAAQHIGRGEIWLARDAVRISMQGKVKRLLQEINHKDTLTLDRDRRIELTWDREELEVLRETSCTYDKGDLVRAFWANIKIIKQLLQKLGIGIDLFENYEKKLIPEIKLILGK